MGRRAVVVLALAVFAASPAWLARPAQPARTAPPAHTLQPVHVAQRAPAVGDEYVVLYPPSTPPAAVHRAVADAGGWVVSDNAALGSARVRSSAGDFLERVDAGGRARGVLVGAARDRAIGWAVPLRRQVEPALPSPTAAPVPASPSPSAGEPLAPQQWDLDAVGAGPAGSWSRHIGDASVTVGVIDTGIDAGHPDLIDRVDVARSRNFTVDVPELDGPCEDELDGSCHDGAEVDEDGHGTHVAGTIAASLNGFGMGGVAPGVTLVNLRAGQDSGYFFLGPVVDALTYAGDSGVDVVNLSFFVDPWLYNCAANPADSPLEQAEQRTIVEAVQRAVAYARARGVTVIAALGNEATDLGRPVLDAVSPNFPLRTTRLRAVDNSCLNVPTELDGVISVSALGPSGRKADYSNYGIEQTDLSAPGGCLRDGVDTPAYRTVQNMVLSSWPAAAAAAERADNDGELPVELVEHCVGSRCAYYKYLQGSSMAAPHAAGVAALAVSRFGADGGAGRGRELSPEVVQSILFGTAVERPCPPGGVETYGREGRPASFDARCTGDAARNGLYGHGVVDATAVLEGGGAVLQAGVAALEPVTPRAAALGRPALIGLSAVVPPASTSATSPPRR